MNLCALPRCSSGDYAASDSLLCEDCIAWVVATLRDTEECIAELRPTKPRGAGGVNPNADYESGSPAADHVLVMLDPRSKAVGVGRTLTGPDDQDEPPLSVAVLGEWAELAGWPAGRHTVRDAVSALLVNHRWITSQDWVVDYVEELTRLHRQAAAAIGDGPPAPVASCTRVIRGEVCGGGIVQWARIAENGHHGEGGARCLECRHSYRGVELIRLRLKEAG
ncbi:hypothetical protein SUDANB95_05499 [Actinosynnema sp. ALI-1.44]